MLTTLVSFLDRDNSSICYNVIDKDVVISSEIEIDGCHIQAMSHLEYNCHRVLLPVQIALQDMWVDKKEAKIINNVDGMISTIFCNALITGEVPQQEYY
jgi:hypothetical protein